MTKTDPDKANPERNLNFMQVVKSRLPKDNPCKKLSLEQILENTDSIILAQIDRIWRRQNEIDKLRGREELTFEDFYLHKILQWYFYKFDLEIAVRKVRTHIIFKHDRWAAIERRKLAKNLTIQGFKSGNRVELISDQRSGEVYMVKPDNCLVVFDDSPTNTDGSKKTYNVPYHALKKQLKRLL